MTDATINFRHPGTEVTTHTDTRGQTLICLTHKLLEGTLDLATAREIASTLAAFEEGEKRMAEVGA